MQMVKYEYNKIKDYSSVKEYFQPKLEENVIKKNQLKYFQL